MSGRKGKFSRTIVWAFGRWEQLLPLLSTAVPLAELRQPLLLDSVEDLPDDEQSVLVLDVANRVGVAPQIAPTVCLLDTGVRRTHVLIAPSLTIGDVHTVLGDGAQDRWGHGTAMAGIALYGSLDSELLSSSPIQHLHRLESVKVLPDQGRPPHDARTYGYVTAQAIALPETAAERRRRAFCLAITAGDQLGHEPSLWSATIDALAVGTDVAFTEGGLELLGAPDPGRSRLFFVSAGNVDGYQQDYLSHVDTSMIEDPAQAWNVLSVGAATDLVGLPTTDPTFEGWWALAARGDVSPHTRTGVLGARRWPIKPDVCLEGGNVLTNGTDFHGNHPLLGVRTTHARSDVAVATANATSAATAQAARLAARAMAVYPTYWPETIRALIVHAAEWTDPMRESIDGESTKSNPDRSRVVRSRG